MVESITDLPHEVLFKETKPYGCKNKHLRPTWAGLCLHAEAGLRQVSLVTTLTHGHLEDTGGARGMAVTKHMHSGVKL